MNPDKYALLQNAFDGDEDRLDEALVKNKPLQRYLYFDEQLTENQKQRLENKYNLDIDKIDDLTEKLEIVTQRGLTEESLIDGLRNELSYGGVSQDDFTKGWSLFMDLPPSHQYKISQWLAEDSANSITTFLSKRITDIENDVEFWHIDIDSYGDESSEFWAWFREVFYDG